MNTSNIWKWAKRVLLGIVGLILLVVVYAVGSIVIDANFGAKSTELTNVTYPGEDGVTLHAYLAEPEEPGTYPGIILIHEWWGLNEGIIVLADALADEGYVVLAVDAYRGEVTNQVPRAIVLRTTTPQEQIFADVDAGFAYLQSLPNVNLDKLASMGFCFGGGQSLQLGMRQSEDLALTVMYYGSVVTDLEALRPLKDSQGVLGIFGEEDQQIFVEDVLEFEAAMNTLEIENEITIYEDVGHAFLNEENYDEPGAAGEAWKQTLEFLEREFGEE